MASRKSRWGWILSLLAVVFVWNVITGDDDQRKAPRPTSSNIQTAPGVTSVPTGDGSFQRIVNPGPLFVVADTLNVRSAPSTSGAVLLKIARGTTVAPTHRAGKWVGVALDNGSLGWLHSDFLSDKRPSEPVATARSGPATPAPSEGYDRSEVIQSIIRASLAGYPGPCPCPYNRMKRGGQCGGRSAYSKPGGYSPICYPGDVTEAMIADFVSRR